ncbi:MAG: hypothetical protein K9I84_11355 [Leadbetterella sp.]|jgi:hypothetical protein|nr:hypothetical protein [Leadbetterella sp.]
MKKLFFISLLQVISCLGFSQNILLDKPVEAGGLILFPDVYEPTVYYYLPNKISLGKQADGKPQFSFMRYVQNVKTGAEEETRGEGDGGGIIHALVQFDVTEDMLKAAQRDIKRKGNGMDSAVIRGPLIYKGGTLAIVSSAADEKGEFTKKVVGVGKAPVIEGTKAAISIHLNKLGSKVLWESFKTATPDLSFSFVMDVSGYRSPIKANIVADFDQIYEHSMFKAGLEGRNVDIGIKAAFSDLVQSGAIKVNNIGSDKSQEELLEIAFNKLSAMMFEPVNTNEQAPQQQADPLGGLAQIIGLASGAATGGVGTAATVAASTKLVVGFQFKKERKRGKFVIDLNKSMSEEVSFRFDENVGSDAVKCTSCYRQVNLDDPFFQQREVLVSVDGLNSDQFAKYINFATISMKKMHGSNGDATIQEVRVGSKEFNAGNVYRLLYGWKDALDNNRADWLKYDYKTTWSFFGDHKIETEWKTSDQIGVNLAPPFHPVKIDFEASPDLVKENQIRLINIKIYYDYGDGEKMEQVTIKSTDKVLAQKAEFMLKNGNYTYDYEINWRLSGNKVVSSGRKKSSDTTLYVDELPQ